MIESDIKQAYSAMNRALTDYIQLTEDFGKIYTRILADLRRKFPEVEIKRDWFGTELLRFEQSQSRYAFLIANFHGDEVFASLSLLLCLEAHRTFDHNILAVPIASKVKRENVDFSFRRRVIDFLERREVSLLVIFSQSHPYLDGFHVYVPSVNMQHDKSRQIIKEVAKHGHEVGAFCSSYDKPKYSVVRAGEDELVSLAAIRGIEAYRFALSQDIWAGYRAMLTLMKR